MSINPTQLAVDAYTKVLIAKRNSIVNALGRGRTMNNAKMLARIDAYEKAREGLLGMAGGAAGWEEYCKTQGYSTKHTAYDFFA
jgi:hypothetical protein